jgi:hypothetical protein
MTYHVDTEHISRLYFTTYYVDTEHISRQLTLISIFTK